jgi:cell division protease FtsH
MSLGAGSAEWEVTEDHLQRTDVVGAARADVGTTRERSRMRRVARLAGVLGVAAAWLWWRAIQGQSLLWFPNIPISEEFIAPLMLVGVLVLIIVVPMLGAGRSPHVLVSPTETGTSMADVRGNPVVREEVIKTLNLFLAHKMFQDQLGGNPRRGILFEGPPGTGKTYLAKAMASEAGVPFLFVSSSAFQSMYYGQTNRKIRSYFKALRKAARQEGGAIGFIEEIDAIGVSRGGMSGGGGREGVSGVVNELLIQLQSFDEPTAGIRIRNWFIDRVNRFLPAARVFGKATTGSANILVVGATNRAADLDPALLRPGRFDRSIHIGVPGREGRRDILDFYLEKKAHDEELGDDEYRDALAAMTMGYSPVMLEHLLDEALVWALRRGADCMSWDDIQQAKMTEELGLKEQVVYTEAERRTIATHEAGHATVAHLIGVGRKLEVLSIIKRSQALGLLSHSDLEERFTSTRTEIEASIRIAFGGMVAEELWFGESGTGPSGDLQAATSAGALMVGSLGMGGSLISFEAAQVPGGANLVAKVVANQAGREQLEAILESAKDEVTQLLEDNRHLVEALRDALLDRHELIGSEIIQVLVDAENEYLDPTIDLTVDPSAIR